MRNNEKTRFFKNIFLKLGGGLEGEGEGKRVGGGGRGRGKGRGSWEKAERVGGGKRFSGEILLRSTSRYRDIDRETSTITT